MLRLRQVCLVARELAPVEAALCDVFDLKVCHRDPAVGAYGLENILLPIGDNFLEIVPPPCGNGRRALSRPSRR